MSITDKIKERIDEAIQTGYTPTSIRIGNAYRREALKELGTSYNGIPIVYTNQNTTISFSFISEDRSHV